MKKTLICIIIAFLSVCVTTAQDFKIVQVTLKSGLVFKGKKGNLSNESISFLSGSTQKTYSLTDVSLIQAKEGKAGKWALGCGGGCLGVCVIAGILSGSQGIEDAGATTGQYVAGSLIWTGIFAGLGAIIGSATDKWNNVYIMKTSSTLKNFNINFGPNQFAKYNFTLAYKF